MIKLDDNITLYNDNCLTVLKALDENSIDTCITDPPYHLTSIVKRFGKENSAPAKYGTDGVFARASAGFMGKEWDGGDIAFRPETWAEVYRVLKPGAYLLAFGGTRTYHRMACAVEDAGFIVMDCAVWAHGQGFPKALNLSKAIDRRLGAERKVIGQASGMGKQNPEWNGTAQGRKENYFKPTYDVTEPVTEEAQLWNGWRTALKPAVELIVIAMKPVDKSYVDNALKWGVAGFNIEGARIETEETIPINKLESWSGFGQVVEPEYEQEENTKGRYPANLLIDDSQEVWDLFPDTGKSTGGRIGKKDVSDVNIVPAGQYQAGDPGFGDSGSAARFFYCAKASRSERNAGLEGMEEGVGGGMQGTADQTLLTGSGNIRNNKMQNHHPTVKPIALMEHLVRLTKTPTGGVVLDPFMGSGTTGIACVNEGRPFIGIEMEGEYFEISKKRIQHYMDKPKQMKLL